MEHDAFVHPIQLHIEMIINYQLTKILLQCLQIITSHHKTRCHDIKSSTKKAIR